LRRDRRLLRPVPIGEGEPWVAGVSANHLLEEARVIFASQREAKRKVAVPAPATGNVQTMEL
jgi:hypothetical protein